jgi:putative transposase
MVRYRRNLVAGGTYFFTVTVLDRRSTILVDNINLLRSAFRIARRERPFAIDAVVLLPEHLHVVMTLPSDDADYLGRWRKIKGLFSRRVAKTLGMKPNARGEYSLWQPRYWEHTIRDENDYERHVDYVHYNPIKHGLVSRVTDWPHSSFHRYVRLGVIPEDWAGDASATSQGYGERIG